jgi:hypothetical protein
MSHTRPNSESRLTLFKNQSRSASNNADTRIVSFQPNKASDQIFIGLKDAFGNHFQFTISSNDWQNLLRLTNHITSNSRFNLTQVFTECNPPVADTYSIWCEKINNWERVKVFSCGYPNDHFIESSADIVNSIKNDCELERDPTPLFISLGVMFGLVALYCLIGIFLRNCIMNSDPANPQPAPLLPLAEQKEGEPSSQPAPHVADLPPPPYPDDEKVIEMAEVQKEKPPQESKPYSLKKPPFTFTQFFQKIKYALVQDSSDSEDTDEEKIEIKVEGNRSQSNNRLSK